MEPAIVLTGVAALLCYLSVFPLQKWAISVGLVDTPNPRSSHSVATPSGGGLVIPLSTLIGAGWYLLNSGRQDVCQSAGFLLGGFLVAAVSLGDDLRGLPRWIRICVHTVAGLLLVFACGPWNSLWIPGAGLIELGAWGFPVTVIWVVGLTNAYNFMDGIDGIAASQGVIAGLGWAIIGSLMGFGWAETIGALLAGSSLGFLVHNWPPARIFMGDVGSTFLGYSLAALGVMAGQEVSRAPLASLLMVFPFVYDTIFTFLRRCLRKEPVLSAHRSHLYQRLVIAGRSHLQVTCLYSAFALISALGAWVWLAVPSLSDLLAPAALILIASGLWLLVVRAEAVDSPAGRDP